MMKRTVGVALPIFILLSLLLSCSSRVESAKKSATLFLESYFQNDLSKALTLCSEELREQLEGGLNGLERLDSNIRERIFQESSKIESRVVGSSELGRDTVVINYQIEHPYFSQSLESSMLLVREGREWLITNFNPL